MKNLSTDITFKKFKLCQLHPSEYNAELRTITDEAISGLLTSLQEFGYVEPIIVNVHKNKNTIIGGHQRHALLLNQLGKNHVVTCVTLDLSDTDEKALNLTLNNLKIRGAFTDALDRYIDELQESMKDKGKLLRLQIAELQKKTAGRSIVYSEQKIKPFKRTHILLSFPPGTLPAIQTHLEKIIKIKGVEYEQGSSN